MAEANVDFWNKVENIVGSKGLIDDPFGLLGTVVRPASTQEVSAILKLCHQHDQSVIPVGGRTGLVEGVDRAKGELAISLERMTKMIEIDPEACTATVECGMPLQALQEAVEEHNLMFPLDLGARGTATIGGNIATNAGGNRVLRYGMTRDMVIAVEAVMADGTIIPLQGKALKNNTGYDLKHLFIGAEGTLGIVTKATLRLRPKPSSQNCAFLAIDGFSNVPKLLSHLQASSAGTLSSFEALWSDYYEFITGDKTPHKPPVPVGHEYYVLVETLGANAEKDATDFEEMLGETFEQGLVADAVIAKSDTEREALWHIRDDVLQLAQLGPIFTFDISVAIGDMESYTDAIKERLDGQFPGNQLMIFGHLGDGNLHVITCVGDNSSETKNAVEEIVYSEVEARNGSVSAEHGIGTQKKAWLNHTRTETEIALMASIKKAFDPKGLLNPGKIFDL